MILLFQAGTVIMSKQRIDAKLKELDTTIRKAQRQSLPFRRIIIEAKKEQRRLQSEYNKERRAANKSAKDAARAEWESLEEKQCAFIKNGNQCGRRMRGKEYCAAHANGQCCENSFCVLKPITNEKYCVRHHPDYEFVRGNPNGYGSERFGGYQKKAGMA